MYLEKAKKVVTWVAYIWLGVTLLVSAFLSLDNTALFDLWFTNEPRCLQHVENTVLEDGTVETDRTYTDCTRYLFRAWILDRGQAGCSFPSRTRYNPPGFDDRPRWSDWVEELRCYWAPERNVYDWYVLQGRVDKR